MPIIRADINTSIKRQGISVGLGGRVGAGFLGGALASKPSDNSNNSKGHMAQTALGHHGCSSYYTIIQDLALGLAFEY